MTLELEPQQDAESLDINQQTWARQGYGVKNPSGGGCIVSVDSGVLGASDTLSVASGTVYVDGAETAVSSASVQINSVASGSGNRRVRKDLIWVDNTGTVQTTEGTAVALSDAEIIHGATRFETVTPYLPTPSETPAVVLAGVVVNETDSEVTLPLLDDRRMPAKDAIGGGDAYTTQTTVTSAYTTSDGEYVYADASGGAITITLPTPEQGARVGIEKTDTSSNTVTIAPDSGEKVNYQTEEDLIAQGESLDLRGDGTDWIVL